MDSSLNREKGSYQPAFVYMSLSDPMLKICKRSPIFGMLYSLENFVFGMYV